MALQLRKRTKRGIDGHTIKVNAPAITPSATPAGAARPDTAPSMTAPLEVPFPVDAIALAAVLDTETEAVVAPDEPAARLEGTAEEDEAELEGVGEVGEVPFEPVTVPPGRYEGGGTALDGSVRAPVPQGFDSPSGWVCFGAGTVALLASAMAKRSVQRRSEALPAWEN
jgi:hypothetical protein